MSNIIILKNGNSPPPIGTLQKGELGLDCKNKLLYIGVSEQENFCINVIEEISELDYENFLSFDTEEIVKDFYRVGYAYVGSAYVS